MWPMLIGAGAPMIMGMMGAQQQGEAAQVAAQQQIDQIEWNNHIQKLQTAQKNRQIASANAAKWMNNILITESAYKANKEEELYIRYNLDNETGYYSSQAMAQNEQLISALNDRNIGTGGTADALKRAARINMERTQEAREISTENHLRDSQRKRDNILNTKRDYNYNQSIKYMPNVYLGQSPEAAGNAAYSAGMASAVMSGVSGGMQGYMYGEQAAFWDSQPSAPGAD
jgi:hypothetical protein